MKDKLFSKLFIATIMVLLVACNDEDDYTTPQAPMVNVKLIQSEDFGSMIVDEEGNTLYFFSKDVSGNSKCEGSCLDIWPAFYVENMNLGEGLNESDFDVITRSDGSKQTTFNGWPLYYFANDQNPGDTNGDGVNDVWYVAKPDYDVMVASAEIKGEEQLFMVDSAGNALYFFLQDDENISNCVDNCLVNWPSFLVDDNPKVPSLINPEDFRVFERNNGGNQSSFKDFPIYYFAGDDERGQTNGHEVNEVWFLFSESLLREGL